MSGGRRQRIVLVFAGGYAAGYAAMAYVALATLHGPAVALLALALAAPPLLALAGAALAREEPAWAPFAGSALVLTGGVPALASAFLLLFFTPNVAWLIADSPGRALVATAVWSLATLAWFGALAASIPGPVRARPEFQVIRRDAPDEA
ncbi:MAG: hypothetical protein ACYDCK_06590 [Thermoplasmatota archaeon]